MADTTNTRKGTFILRYEFYPQVKLLTREQRGDLLTALFAYSSGDDIPILDGITAMCFEFIKASIDTYSEKYEAKCRKNQENGKKGGRPKKADANGENHTETDQSETNQTDSEKTERFNEKASETKKSQCTGDKSGNENTDKYSNRQDSEKTNRFSKQPNASEKTERVKKNHDSDSDSDSELFLVNNYNTHTNNISVSTNTAGAPASTHPRVTALLAWVKAQYPAVQRMEEPFTEQHLQWMLAKYSEEDIRRIIGDMDNKKATKNKSAFSTFSGFAGRDTILREKKAAEKMAGKLYTYTELCDFIASGKYTAEDFQSQKIDGKTYWQKATDIISSAR